MQTVPLDLGQRERTQTKFYYETSNNEEVSKRLWEEHERQAKQRDRQDQLAQRELDMVREFQPQTRHTTRAIHKTMATAAGILFPSSLVRDRIVNSLCACDVQHIRVW